MTESRAEAQEPRKRKRPRYERGPEGEPDVNPECKPINGI